MSTTAAIVCFLLLSTLSGCNSEQRTNPTTPAGEHVIIVDSQAQTSSENPECGTADAPCATLLEALTIAETVQGGVPTIWLKAGSYQLGTDAPLEIRTSIILQAEENRKVEIHSGTSAFHIFASNVSIEGLSIISHDAGQVTSVMLKGGQALFKDTTISNQGNPADPSGMGLSIDNGGHAVLENSRVETLGAGAIDVFNGKLSIQNSTIQADSEAVRIYKTGRGTFERSVFKGNLFTTGGSLTVTQSETKDISIADGAYATLRENIIRGSVSLMWKHAYAEIRENQVYGRISAIDAKATVENNKIYGDQQGEGVTAFNFAMLTLTNNSISSMQTALYAYPSSMLTLNHNQFNSETEGKPTIFCETPVTIKSDGANTLQNTELHISCEGLPSNPGTGQF